jgi:hypothetical protein
MQGRRRAPGGGRRRGWRDGNGAGHLDLRMRHKQARSGGRGGQARREEHRAASGEGLARRRTARAVEAPHHEHAVSALLTAAGPTAPVNATHAGALGRARRPGTAGGAPGRGAGGAWRDAERHTMPRAAVLRQSANGTRWLRLLKTRQLRPANGRPAAHSGGRGGQARREERRFRTSATPRPCASAREPNPVLFVSDSNLWNDIDVAGEVYRMRLEMERSSANLSVPAKSVKAPPAL